VAVFKIRPPATNCSSNHTAQRVVEQARAERGTHRAKYNSPKSSNRNRSWRDQMLSKPRTSRISFKTFQRIGKIWTVQKWSRTKWTPPKWRPTCLQTTTRLRLFQVSRSFRSYPSSNSRLRLRARTLRPNLPDSKIRSSSKTRQWIARSWGIKTAKIHPTFLQRSRKGIKMIT